jgi:hypothetical protein
MYIWDSIFGFNDKFWEYQNKIKDKINNNEKILYGKFI